MKNSNQITAPNATRGRLKIGALVLLLVLAISCVGCARGEAGIELPTGSGTIDALAVTAEVALACDEMLKEQQDDYAAYFPPEDFTTFLADVTGNYNGIGVYLYDNPASGRVTVMSAMKGMPAQKAGLLPGDEFVKVNNESVEKLDSAHLSELFKGEGEAKFELEMYRPNAGKVQLSVKRAKISVPSVDYQMLKGQEGLGYIAISTFNNDTAEAFGEAISDLIYQGMDGLILDLRNNGGGEVDQALMIADYFVPAGQVLVKMAEKTKVTDYKSTREPIGIPVVVLQNAYTASASEMLLGALLDHQVGKSVGVQSFGKGIVQTIWPLGNNAGVRSTTAQYFTPNGHNIHKAGIAPTQVVELPKDASPTVLYSLNAQQDPQFGAALELLKQDVAANPLTKK